MCGGGGERGAHGFGVPVAAEASLRAAPSGTLGCSDARCGRSHRSAREERLNPTRESASCSEQAVLRASCAPSKLCSEQRDVNSIDTIVNALVALGRSMAAGSSGALRI